MGKRYEVTLNEAQACLDYNHETGVFTWKIDKGRHARRGDVAGSVHKSGYRRVGLCGALVYAHRLAWLMHYGRQPADQIDHINGSRDDNRIDNLREANFEINAQNRVHGLPKAGTSGIIGVVSDAEGKSWSSHIHFKGKVVRVSGFSSIEEAHYMYMELKRRLHDGYVPARTESGHPLLAMENTTTDAH